MGTSYLQKRFQLWWLQALYTMFATGVVTVLYFYFVAQSISFLHIFFADTLSSIVIVLYFVFRQTLRARRSIAVGFLVLLASLLPFVLPLPILYIFFPYMILRGLGGIMFFTPYNIQFFARTQSTKKLQSMTMYWAVGILAGFIAPILGGYILGMLGVSWLLGVGSVLLLVSIFVTQYIDEETYTYTSREALSAVRGVRSITAIDGALHKVMGIVVIFFSLSYITTEINFGLYLSVAALVSLVGATILAKKSDMSGKRFVYIALLSVCAGVVAFGMSFVHTSFAFIVSALLLKFISVLQEPIRANVLQDHCKQEPITWISREIYLNIGRAIVTALITVLVYTRQDVYVFYLVAGLFFLYPVLVYTKSIYAKTR